jgi:hypothetical protein
MANGTEISGLLPQTRRVRITGFAQWLTLFGGFTNAAEMAIRDGWISVTDFWDVVPNPIGESAVEFLYRFLYAKKLAKPISSLSLAEQFNLGHPPVSGPMVIADLTGLPGLSHEKPLRGDRYRYDSWRETHLPQVKMAATALMCLNAAMTQINAEPDIAPDDKRYLRGLILMRALASKLVSAEMYRTPQPGLVTSYSGSPATQTMTAEETQHLLKLEGQHNYVEMAKLMKRVLPRLGFKNW